MSQRIPQPQSKVAFIVGHYKSGSTWLVNLLSLHPEIRGVSETHIFRYAHDSRSLADATNVLFSKAAWAEGGIRNLPKRRLADLAALLGLKRSPPPPAERPHTLLDMSHWQRRELRACLSQAADPIDYCRRFFGFLQQVLKPRRYLIDKTPTNVFQMERIETTFPGSKYIAIYRDGRDVAVSEKYYRGMMGERPVALRESIDRWLRAMDAQRAASEHYSLFTLRYEDLLSQPHEQINRLLDYLDLDRNPAIVSDMVARASFEHTTGRKRGQADNRKFYRKGIAGDWRNHFSPADAELFAEQAGALLVELGYETSCDPAMWNLHEPAAESSTAAV